MLVGVVELGEELEEVPRGGFVDGCGFVEDVEDVQGNLGVVAVEDGTVGEDSDESFLDDDVGRGDREEFGDE